MNENIELNRIIVSPNQKQVINLSPEFIKKQDGHQKQDCENAAVKRWLNKNHQNKYGYPVTLLKFLWFKDWSDFFSFILSEYVPLKKVNSS